MKAAGVMRFHAPQRGQVTWTSKPLSAAFVRSQAFKGRERSFSPILLSVLGDAFVRSPFSRTFAEAGNVSRVKHCGSGRSVGRLIGGGASEGSAAVSSVAATASEAETAKLKQGLGFLEAVSTVSSVSASVKSAVSTSLSVR
jgi:hypothetical protein